MIPVGSLDRVCEFLKDQKGIDKSKFICRLHLQGYLGYYN